MTLAIRLNDKLLLYKGDVILKVDGNPKIGVKGTASDNKSKGFFKRKKK